MADGGKCHRELEPGADISSKGQTSSTPVLEVLRYAFLKCVLSDHLLLSERIYVINHDQAMPHNDKSAILSMLAFRLRQRCDLRLAAQAVAGYWPKALARQPPLSLPSVV